MYLFAMYQLILYNSDVVFLNFISVFKDLKSICTVV